MLVSGLVRAGDAGGMSKAELVTKVKAASVYIETPKGSGSGFCIDAAGIFLTNHHVVSGLSPEAVLTVVVDSNLPTQKQLKAKVIRADEKADLAMLAAVPATICPSVQLGTVDGLSELVELVVFGFPFGKALSDTAHGYPSISVNKTNVSALRHDSSGKLEFIQLDSSLNPGNSGGPVVDQSGKVVGVVVAGIQGAGINLIIPVSTVTEFLGTPVISLTVPAITVDDAYEAKEFTASIVGDPRLKSQAFDVELVLSAQGRMDRKVAMKPVNGWYAAKIGAMESQSGPPPVTINAVYGTGSVVVQAKDGQVTVGSKSLKFSQLDFVQVGKGEARTSDGVDLSGKITGLEAVPVKIGTQTVTLNLAEAASASFQPPMFPDLTCTVVVKSSGKEVGRLSKTVILTEKRDPAQDGMLVGSLESVVQGVFKKPRRASVRQNGLRIISTPGDYIGGGKRYDYQRDALKCRVDNGRISVQVDGWTLELSPGKGRPIKIGTYDDAMRYPFNDNKPGLSFSGNGRGSNTLTGKFVIWELKMNGIELQELAVDFIQHSEGGPSALAGSLRINSTLE